jgi:hypothetical protein
MVRDNELSNVGPISGENKGLVQKVFSRILQL